MTAKSPIALAIEALEPFWRAVGNFQGAYEDEPVCDGLVVADIRNAAEALAELKAASLISDDVERAFKAEMDALVRMAEVSPYHTERSLQAVQVMRKGAIKAFRAAMAAYVAAIQGRGTADYPTDMPEPQG